jgi:PAS domain-containing protein
MEASNLARAIAEPNGAMNIVYANKAFSVLAGSRQDEIIGKNWRLLQGPKAEPNMIAHLIPGAEDIDLCGQCLVGHGPPYRLLLRRPGRGPTLPKRRSNSSAPGIRAVIARAEATEVNLTSYRRDGSTFLNRLYLAPVLDEITGHPIAFIGIHLDLSNLQRQRRLDQEYHDFALDSASDLSRSFSKIC